MAIESLAELRAKPSVQTESLALPSARSGLFYFLKATATHRVTAAIFVGALLMLLLWFLTGLSNESFAMGVSSRSSELRLKKTLTATHRKLLRAKNDQVVEPNRSWGETCTNDDIRINQFPTAPLPNGIPAYSVEIMNMCVTGCNISRIHLSCGWFSSANLINPKVFKRLRYGDCLVNNGEPLINGGTLFFQYANTYPYSLSVSSLFC